MVKLVILFSLFSFLSFHINAENFYSELCSFRQEFELERLFREDIDGKIISRTSNACDFAKKYSDFGFQLIETIAPQFEGDSHSQAFIKLVQESNGGIQQKEHQTDVHLKSLLIGLAVAHSWKDLSLAERMSFATNATCGSSAEVFKLPQFFDLSNNPGKGNPKLSDKLEDLCDQDNPSKLIEKLPRAMIMDAFFLLKESGYDLKPFVRKYCYSQKTTLEDGDDTFFKNLYERSTESGALKTMENFKELFGLNPRAIKAMEDSFIFKQGLSDEEIEALKVWKGNAYIWMSNREEFGVFGNLLSIFHENGGQYRKPEDLGTKVETLNEALDEIQPHTGLVYRGTSAKNPESTYAVGETFEFKRYSSTSTRVRTAYSFAGEGSGERVLLVLLSKSGRNIIGIDVNKAEREILFPPGAKFKVVHSERDNYTYKVYAIEE